jgi:hypothetical protein
MLSNFRFSFTSAVRTAPTLFFGLVTIWQENQLLYLLPAFLRTIVCLPRAGNLRGVLSLGRTDVGE